MNTFLPEARRLFKWLIAGVCVLAGAQASAHHTDTHFEDKSEHQVVYQLNKADPEYMSHILFSAGEMIRKYADNVEVVIAVFGPGIHLLGKQPQRPIPQEIQERAASLSAYGVAFHACANTMKSVNWTEKDLLDYAKIVPIGVDDIMQLQEKGFSYISW